MFGSIFFSLLFGAAPGAVPSILSTPSEIFAVTVALDGTPKIELPVDLTTRKTHYPHIMQLYLQNPLDGRDAGAQHTFIEHKWHTILRTDTQHLTCPTAPYYGEKDLTVFELWGRSTLGNKGSAPELLGRISCVDMAWLLALQMGVTQTTCTKGLTAKAFLELAKTDR